jgi:hypothetical protein
MFFYLIQSWTGFFASAKNRAAKVLPGTAPESPAGG